MPTLSVCWLEQRVLVDGDTMSASEALDAGEYAIAEVVVTVESAGTGDAPLLVLQHAPRNSEASWLGFEPGQSVDLTAAGKTWIHLDAFTRFLGWSLSGTLETSATVTIEVVAKA